MCASCPNGASPANCRRTSRPRNTRANASSSRCCPFHGSMRASMPTVRDRTPPTAASGDPADTQPRRARDHLGERAAAQVRPRRLERRMRVRDDAVGARQHDPHHQFVARPAERLDLDQVAQVHDERHARRCEPPALRRRRRGRCWHRRGRRCGTPARCARRAACASTPRTDRQRRADAPGGHPGGLSNTRDRAGDARRQRVVDAERIDRGSPRAAGTATTAARLAACGAVRTRRRR